MTIGDLEVKKKALRELIESAVLEQDQWESPSLDRLKDVLTKSDALIVLNEMVSE